MSYKVTWQDKFSQKLCNLVLRIASKEYRAWVQLGMLEAMDRASSEVNMEQVQNPRLATITVIVKFPVAATQPEGVEIDAYVAKSLMDNNVQFALLERGVSAHALVKGYKPQ